MKKTAIEKKQYFISAGILLIGCIISAVILFAGGNKNTADAEKSAETGETVPANYEVSFYDADGELLETRSVTAGSPVIPPRVSQSGHFFRGWSTDLYAISENTEVYPIFEEIVGETNILYAETVYSDTATQFHIVPTMDGTVDCCAFSVEIAYDGDLLKVETVHGGLDGLTSNETMPGLLTLSYDGDKLSKKTILADICFSCRQSGSYKTEINLSAHEIYTVRGTERVYSESIAYPANIYLFENKE